MGFLGFGEKKSGGLDPKDVADMLHAVMEADRSVYAKMVVQRLTLQDKVITASEHFADEKALLRGGATWQNALFYRGLSRHRGGGGLREMPQRP